MLRTLAALCLAFITALSVPASSNEAAAQDFVWRPAGPVATSVGMQAVATDPDHPLRLWLASATSVWVSDDGGQNFDLVLQLPRSAGEMSDQERDEAEEEAAEQAALDRDGGDADDFTGGDLSTDLSEDAFAFSVEDMDEDELATIVDDELDDEGDGSVRRSGITRLRVIGDSVYACTSRGLFVFDRDAVALGSGYELRFGQRQPVLDVAQSPDGRLWIGTLDGLFELDASGVGRPVRGLEEDLEIRALAIMAMSAREDGSGPVWRMAVATSRGLRVSQGEGEGFERLSVGSREDAGLEDLIVSAEGHLVVSGAGEVAQIAVPVDESFTVLSILKVPGASRLAFDRAGLLWVVGAQGSWTISAQGEVERLVEGLFDRRLWDLAPAYDEKSHLWAAGRSGANQLLVAVQDAFDSSVEQLFTRATEGYPTAEEVLDWAIAKIPITPATIESWVLKERLAWLLPHIQFRFNHDRRRRERFVYVPELDRYSLDEISARPLGDQWRVTAYWDVMPAILMALDGGRQAYELPRNRARKELERVRATVVPLYASWREQRMALESKRQMTTKELVKSLLTLQRIESDLYVYTNGHFPISEIRP